MNTQSTAEIVDPDELTEEEMEEREIVLKRLKELTQSPAPEGDRSIQGVL